MHSLLLAFSQARPQTRMEPILSNDRDFVGKNAPCTWSLSLRWVFGKWKCMGGMVDDHKCTHDGDEYER